MEVVSRKRGRPRVVVTEAVAEARRLAAQQRNLRRDRRKRDHATMSGSASTGPTTTDSITLAAGDTSIDHATMSGSASTGPTTTDSITLAAGDTSIEAPTSSGSVTETRQPPPGGAVALLPETSLQRRRLNKKKQTFAANNSILDIGNPDQRCGCCAAHVWQAEYTGRPSGPGPKGYSICCGKGKVQLPLLQETPAELAALLGGTNSRAKKFQKNIRVYNIIFALCSFGGSVDESINNGSGPFVFRVNDLTYHSIGSLLPPDGHTPKFAQFYMYDGQEAIEHRVNFPRDSSVLDPAIVATLQEMLGRDNALVGIFKQLRERYPPSEQIPVRLRLLERRSTDGRFVSILSQNDYEFAGLALDNNFTDNRDILVEYKKTGLKTISELHPCFMSLQYPLLFPRGEDGYRLGIKHRNVEAAEPSQRNTVSGREYQAFRLQYRDTEGHTLLLGGRLFLQYIVDAWCCVERGRLQWVQQHQSTIRSDLYNNIVDCVNQGDVSAADVGKRIVLPSSFTGGFRYMQQNYQDSIAVCKEYGHPDLFITFTCNPKWMEIQRAVTATGCQDASVRPDLIARVFKMKLDAMMSDLTKENVLGRVLAGALFNL